MASGPDPAAMRFILSCLVFVFALLAQGAMAQSIPPGTQWHEAGVTLLDVEFGDGFHARWEYFQCDCGDVLVRMEQSAPDGETHHELRSA